MSLPGYDEYLGKMRAAFEAHGLPLSADSDGRFSPATIDAANAGDWTPAARELAAWLKVKLNGILADHHEFAAEPYVRQFSLPDGDSLSVAIINAQGEEWYGTDAAVGAFDFLRERRLGLFNNCRSFLDLGGHQFVWAVYYAMTSPDAEVVTFEPSILNVAIGLFNALVNGVAERVHAVPFAVESSLAAGGDEGSKMLVDFLTVPLLAKPLSETVSGSFDFIKTDIEGYEFEMLKDPSFVQLMHDMKCGHLELHLGHLSGRGVGVHSWTERLRSADLHGTELYSGTDMYEYLERSDPNGFYAFVIRP